MALLWRNVEASTLIRSAIVGFERCVRIVIGRALRGVSVSVS